MLRDLIHLTRERKLHAYDFRSTCNQIILSITCKHFWGFETHLTVAWVNFLNRFYDLHKPKTQTIKSHLLK